MGLQIREDDLTGSEIARFLEEHLTEMREVTPPESVHALDLEGLRSPAITFWSVWDGADLVGSGALKELDPHRGEIKSMRTSRKHRRRGIAARMLEHILLIAKAREYGHLYLETGAMEAFVPARALYERYGFGYRGPFGAYIEDPNSVFMVKKL
ncbi:GNAT family N-acetyltransferase [filamentous cyanobacterium CCP5]|nr:GNAT family N-acetyltransferase [filamentous cyanobacterium CCP5]